MFFTSSISYFLTSYFSKFSFFLYINSEFVPLLITLGLIYPVSNSIRVIVLGNYWPRVSALFSLVIVPIIKLIHAVLILLFYFYIYDIIKRREGITTKRTNANNVCTDLCHRMVLVCLVMFILPTCKYSDFHNIHTTILQFKPLNATFVLDFCVFVIDYICSCHRRFHL